MSIEYVWNGLRVRRDEMGEWLRSVRLQGDLVAWAPIRTQNPLGAAVIAELNKLYPPPPRTVTLDEYAFTAHSDEEGHWWHNDDCGTFDDHPLGKALDRIWELENRDER